MQATGLIPSAASRFRLSLFQQRSQQSSRARRRLGLLLVATLAACANLPAPEKPALAKEEFSRIPPYMEGLIRHTMREKKLSGLSIALVARGELVWSQGFGLADQQTSVNADTRFRSGSLAKTLNALMVMRLVEQGRLHLDAPIQTWIPEFSIKSRFSDSPPITLRNLLSHQSGLPSDLIQGMWASQPEPYSTVLEYLSQVYVAQPAEQLMNYSNLGFNLIGLAIERASEQPYEEVMKAFLQELGMANSAFSPSPFEPLTAAGFQRGKIQTELSLRDVPAAGLSSSANDLAKLLRVLVNEGKVGDHEIISAASLQEMQRDLSSEKPFNIGKRAGLGLFFYDDIFHPSLRLYVHDGATPNHRSLMIFAPEHDYGVVLMANSATASASLFQLANSALSLLHEATYGRFPPQKHIAWPSRQPEDITDPSELAGHYATSFGLAKIYLDGDQLRCRFAGKTFDLLDRHNTGLYFLRYRWLGLFPIELGQIGRLAVSARQIENRRVLVAHTTVGNKILLGEKIQPVNLDEKWTARRGKYRSKTPLEVIDLPSGGIKIVDGFLIAYAKTESGEALEYVLQPVNDDEAIVAGIGRGLGETVFFRSIEGRDQAIFSNIIFEKIRH